MSTTDFVISIEGRAQSTGESGQGLEPSMTRLRPLSFANLSMTGRSFCKILGTISFCGSAKSFWASSGARLRLSRFMSICRLRSLALRHLVLGLAFEVVPLNHRSHRRETSVRSSWGRTSSRGLADLSGHHLVLTMAFWILTMPILSVNASGAEGTAMLPF